MPSGEGIAQGVHCGAGPVNTAVGIHLASGCLVFVYSDTASYCHSQLWKRGQGSAGMRSVLDPFQLKCGSFKLFFFKQTVELFIVSKAKSHSTSESSRTFYTKHELQCSGLVFLYVQNAEMFLKLNKQYYIFKIVLYDDSLNV